MPVLIVILVILLAVVLAGLYFATLIIYPKTRPVEANYQREVENGKLVEAEFAALPKQELSVRSPFGYSLYGIYIPFNGSRRTVIIVHGIKDTLYICVKYLNLFRKRGFNVLLYDQRNHGHNRKINTTFGYYEKHDLKAVMDWALEKVGPDGVVGTMGESLGAAVVLQHAAIDPRAAFVVADCPYSNLTQLIHYLAKRDYHLPAFPLLYIADFFCGLLSGMRLSYVSPIKDIVGVELPVFWIHGQGDDYIPPQMSVDMYNAKRRGIKKLFLAPNAGHAEAYWNNREEYDRQIGEFLAEAGLESQPMEHEVLSDLQIQFRS